jgi:hypothetical protein
MGRFLPPDHSAGDANTIGGYQAVHARPAAFEGSDGTSYSVEIVVDETGDPAQPYAGYLLFVRWTTTDFVAAGHLETQYLTFGLDEATVAKAMGSLRLSDAKHALDEVIAQQTPPADRPPRPWYEVMHDENGDDES